MPDGGGMSEKLTVPLADLNDKPYDINLHIQPINLILSVFVPLAASLLHDSTSVHAAKNKTAGLPCGSPAAC